MKWAKAWKNYQYDLCTQEKLRSAWANSQADQSFLGTHLSKQGLKATNEQMRWELMQFCLICHALAQMTTCTVTAVMVIDTQ